MLDPIDDFTLVIPAKGEADIRHARRIIRLQDGAIRDDRAQPARDSAPELAP